MRGKKKRKILGEKILLEGQMLLSMGRAALISYDLIFLLGRFTNKEPHVNSIGFHLQPSPGTGKNL
jgi:hypothetical protein